MKTNYAMTEVQMETLAAEYGQASAETQRIGMTYLRVIVTGCQAVLGKVRRGRVALDAQQAVLNDVTGKYYAAVLRGVTTPDLAADPTLDKAELTRRSLERNRLSTFARSAKSTLAAFVSAGGDLRGLEVETVTRDPLMAFVREARGESNEGHALERAQNRVLRLIAAQAKADPAGAMDALERAIEAFQNAFDELSANGNVERAAPIVEPPPDKRDRAPRSTDPLTMTGVLRTRPVHARMKAPVGRGHA